MKNILFVLGAISLAVLVGCGGGSSSSSDNNVPQTSTVAVTVIDGAIKNAKACLDKNLNGICDAGEPAGTTDASGKTTLTVDNADVGKYPIVAMIGTDAVDADTGAVTVAYTLRAPADQTAVVSPYTSLVQSTIESTGASTADAAKSVKDQTGLNISVFSDYTKDTGADAKTAQILANAIVVTTQQQSTTVSGAAGQKTSDGATVTPADLNKLVQQKISTLMPQLVAAANDSAVQSAPLTERMTKLSSKATDILKTDGIQSADGAVAAVEDSKAPSTTDTTPTAGASTSKFLYINATNFEVRLMSSSVADNTPDANNLVGYREYRYQNSGSTNTAAWGAGSSPKRGSDLHWNGTQWRTCPINWKNTQTLRDAKGFSSYNYCDNRETGSGTRATVDVSGKTMVDVYKSVRSQGYTNIAIGDGTDASAASILGTTTVFPTGSKLHYQTNTSLSTAATYYPGSDNYVALQDAKLASGDATACSASPSPASTVLNVTLDKLIAISKGTPCVGTKRTVTGLSGSMDSGATNEGWGATTLSMGTVGTASANASTINGVVQASTYYTTNTRLRVAFGDGNVAKYYQCQERYDGNVRNCTLTGTGTYAIQTLEDGRTMTFNGLPAYFGNLDYKRVFVERNGYVYYGYQNRPDTYSSARLNLAALNAVAAQLLLPAHDPGVPQALTFTSYQGIWDAYPDSDPNTVGESVSITSSGQLSCLRAGSSCTLNAFNRATGAFEFTNAYSSGGSSTITGTLDFLKGTGVASFSGSGGTGTAKLTRR